MYSIELMLSAKHFPAEISNMVDASGYNDSHRLLLQAIMSHGIMDSAEVNEAFRNCHKIAGIPMPVEVISGLASHILTINKKIKPLQLEIKKAVSENDGHNYIVLVNRMNNVFSKSSGVLTVNQFELVKLIISKIINSDQRYIRSTDFLNATEQLEKKMSKREAQDLLTKLTADMWLYNDHGKIYLHTRAVCELEPYLRDQFDVDVCPNCSRVVILAAEQTCQECGKRAHKHCMTKCFTRLSGKAPHCLYENCGAEWPYELNITNGQLSSQLIQTPVAPAGGSQRSAAGKSAVAKKRPRHVIQDEDDDE